MVKGDKGFIRVCSGDCDRGIGDHLLMQNKGGACKYMQDKKLGFYHSLLGCSLGLRFLAFGLMSVF